ncbi:hypothetical protein AVEN_274406-1 [Araneus ventricosus]|uniref:Uncharacterized protein n=1 Tax=Araneus ventricosus TaxID=182803 RepID=A0A4Y2E530_ARAVE|nr:hypothetical protein AVEN_274406-1 [Araneus ventricosus]
MLVARHQIGNQFIFFLLHEIGSKVYDVADSVTLGAGLRQFVVGERGALFKDAILTSKIRFTLEETGAVELKFMKTLRVLLWALGSIILLSVSAPHLLGCFQHQNEDVLM